ncbi:MAG TPA: hypothetical protein PK045_03260 [Candidatus Woesebacteria bacterium]|nr:hypothetical protein [Candidatus Woesebacteria bacterium]
MIDELPQPQKNIPQESKVNFSVDGQQLSVDLQDVNKLFSDMEKYNNHFSIGNMLARTLITQFKLEKNSDQTQFLSGVANETDDQQINAFFLISAHQNLLNNIGLVLEPVSGKATVMIDDGDSVGNGEMRVNLNDQERFTSFLGVLTPEQVNDTGIKRGLEEISRVLGRQILDKYDLQTPEEEAMQLFMGLDRIIAEYKRLEMGKSVFRLENYLNHGKTGDLREYVIIEKRGLLSKPGKSFGPADWQKDSSKEMLEARWDEAISVLEMSKLNPKAKILSEQLYLHLSMCVDVALESISSLEYLTPENRQKMQLILEVAKQKMEMMSYNTQNTQQS